MFLINLTYNVCCMIVCLVVIHIMLDGGDILTLVVYFHDQSWWFFFPNVNLVWCALEFNGGLFLKKKRHWTAMKAIVGFIVSYWFVILDLYWISIYIILSIYSHFFYNVRVDYMCILGSIVFNCNLIMLFLGFEPISTYNKEHML